MRKRTLKYVSLCISISIVVLGTGISGCLTDPYSVGEPDLLFSEFVLVWDLMNSHYACFFAKEDVDWDQTYQDFKPAALNLNNRDELIDLCLDMLSELEDQSLALRDSTRIRLGSWNRGDFPNWDLTVWTEYMQSWNSMFIDISLLYYGTLIIPELYAHNIGYSYISNMGSGYDWMSFFGATNTIIDCDGLILDLRMCGGSGSKTNAFYTCGRFIDEFTLGYYRVFRVGPGRNDMGEMLEVLTYKNGAWQFTKPIILLTGRYTQGAAEQLVLLLRTQQHVTVIGDTTAGFANPAVSFNLTENWTIEIPEMATYSPDGTLILNSGIAPDIFIPVSEADFAAGVDPVINAAIDMLDQ